MGARTLPGTVTLPRPGDLPDKSWDEPRFQRWVVATARANGWRVRVLDARTGINHRRSHASDRGWPDLVMVNRGRDELAWVELKAVGGLLRPDQREVIEMLLLAGETVHIWDPSDWEEVLRTL